jgi:hypothetical protein
MQLTGCMFDYMQPISCMSMAEHPRFGFAVELDDSLRSMRLSVSRVSVI